MTLKEALLLLFNGTKASALDGDTKLWREVAGRNTDRRVRFSSRHSFRGQSVQTSCGCSSVPLCDEPRWEAATVGVPRPFDYQTSSCITTVATRATSDKYISRSHVQDQVSGYISRMTESYSS